MTDTPAAPATDPAADPVQPAPTGEPDDHGGHPRASLAALALAALGVVFGDIGTSPLYALQTVFTIDNRAVQPTPGDVYGVISLVFWSITLIVSTKQLMFVTKADNDGEGGILSLAYLTRAAVRVGGQRYVLVMLIGVFGASLFFGDSLITPAISVLSAVEGLFGGVILLMLTFRASERLATAYGVAVTMDLMLTTLLFCVYAAARLKWGTAKIAAFAISFGILEVTYFAGNVAKVLHGGWLPLLVAATLSTVMMTWRRGTTLVTERRTRLEGELEPFVDVLHEGSLAKVPGTAIFLHPNASTTPLALRENADFNKVMHAATVIVTTRVRNVPHVPDSRRVTIDDLGDPYDAITHVTLDFGFQDDQDVPAGLAVAVQQGLEADLDDAVYFLSRITVHESDRPGMARWRKRLFVAMAHNAANATAYFHLPLGRTVVMGAQVRF